MGNHGRIERTSAPVRLRQRNQCFAWMVKKHPQR
jgi:hypothetical protein